ncbi:MAG: galactokinase [Lentisphaerae bacterium]|nr:galactokinase [Lentisphaerota bacterium]
MPPNADVLNTLKTRFAEWFGAAPAVAAYAPGRVEILGNHTDYNEGFVLSAAIDVGTFFVAAPSSSRDCRLVAGDIMEETRFGLDPEPTRQAAWSNYVRGVLAGLEKHGSIESGFLGMFLGNVPLGAGLSSSAALEMSSGIALAALYGINVAPAAMAKIGQTAEHHFAGVKCGLLDQITSLHGRAHHLVRTDFRTLETSTVPLGPTASFLMCNTKAKHSLVESAYNERRAKCEEAARYFASVLKHPVTHLRDVSWKEWEQYSAGMDPAAAKRSAHVVGENDRVMRGRVLLEEGRLNEFGELMFQSHESSRTMFENSCRELDLLVDAARQTRGVLGARLSGGGFGGSVVALIEPPDAVRIAAALSSAYEAEFGHPCETRVLTPSDGASAIPLSDIR